jgi:hypothetical protein
MKYKHIPSAAHNFGHSFLSNMNFVGTGRRYTMVPDAIFRAARIAQAPLVRIDFLRLTIEPKGVATPEVWEAVKNYADWLPKLLASHNVEPESVNEAALALRFDFDASRASLSDPAIEIPSVECVVTFIDNRGRAHEARPENWCYQ